ncbi:unnamed protein product [Rhizoctonia solani]|uniref:Uncharacterized protein n=1 Tax=Rhizoctonia solani TaxID=456999 RepID=A0A8H3BW91_9AGAM|nr:unnamed protein product [Rhizoctonia solani]
MDPWTPALFSSFPPGFSSPSLPFSVRSHLKMTGTSLKYQVTTKYIQDTGPTGEYLDPYISYAFPENESLNPQGTSTYIPQEPYISTPRYLKASTQN